jgi:hypothetical protein
MKKIRVHRVLALGAIVLAGCLLTRVDTPLPARRGGHVSMAAGDLDGDGLADLVVGHLPGGPISKSATATALISLGDGAFRPEPTPFREALVRAVVLADWNRDARLDLALQRRDADGLGPVVTFLGRGDGTFDGPIDEIDLVTGSALAAGDLSGDGLADLVYSDGDTQRLLVALGRGDGTFDTPAGYRGHHAHDLALGDLDGDGALDVAIARSGEVRTLINAGGGRLRPIAAAHPAGRGARAISLFDMDGDRVLDAITADADDDTVSVLLGRGDGTFGRRTAYPAGARPVELAVGYLDLGRAPDVVTANADGDSVSVLFGRGRGLLGARALEIPVGEEPVQVALVDVTGDGALEIVTANRTAATVTALLGPGR